MYGVTRGISKISKMLSAYVTPQKMGALKNGLVVWPAITNIYINIYEQRALLY